MTDTLGPYELLRFIGRGGMGEVHLARDTRLHREVALKLLPPELAEDPERRARFLREARAAAALNHPNVTTIHEVGQADGRDYIAQEYLDGRPLNEIIAERPLPLAELADLAVPLADALEYAHSCGVIHRDLKPANVIVTSRGQAKLLDFGLAKVLQPEEGPGKPEEPSTTLTLSGAVFGTPSAMSPEQALGKTVDARSDVFSFGALLYEMATAKPAFLGTTIQETLDKVLHAEPEPLARVRRDLPSDFVAIVEKALRKNPDERYQSMSEVVADLRHFKRSTDSGVVPPAAGGLTGSSTSKLRRFALPVALLVIAVLGWRLLTTGGNAGLRLTNPKQLTSAVGMEDAPCWAPEGGLIAYMAAAPGEELDIWLMQEGSGTPVNRTPNLDGNAIFPSISPDGRTIAFWLVDNLDSPGALVGPRGLYTMPVLGGSPRVLIRGAYSHGPLQWSADGSRMAFFQPPPGIVGEPTTVRIASSAGETLRDITLPEMPDRARADLSWSPDGRFFAFVNTADPQLSDTNRLWILDESEGSCVPLTDGRTRASSPRWSSDGRSLLYVSNQGGTMDLWRQAIDGEGAPEGDPVVLSAGLGMGRCTLSADGRRLIYSRGGLVSNIWRMPLLSDRPATWADAQQVTYDEAYIEYADLSPDGQWLALSSDRAGNDDLWLTPAEGGTMRQLTTDPTPDWFPRWSPDGQQLLFYAYRSGNRDLWVMPSEGGPARQLTTDPGTDWFGDWSPDGKSILWSSSQMGRAWPHTSALAPFDPLPLPRLDKSVPTRSVGCWVDNESFLFTWDDLFTWVGIDGTVVRSYPEAKTENNSFVLTPDKRFALYSGKKQFHALDLDSGEVATITDFSGRPGSLGLVAATNGEQVWFTWQQARGDLWMMDVEEGR